MAKNFEIICPCCEATIVVDRITGEVLLHKAKESPKKASFDAMVSGLKNQRDEMARKFDKELESQKDRGRILEERFKEAIQRADKSDKPPINPFDLD